MDLARNEVDAGYLRILTQSTCQFDYVFALASGVGVAAEFKVVPANKSVDANQGDV